MARILGLGPPRGSSGSSLRFGSGLGVRTRAVTVGLLKLKLSAELGRTTSGPGAEESDEIHRKIL